jgi:hypothetical protein
MNLSVTLDWPDGHRTGTKNFIRARQFEPVCY